MPLRLGAIGWAISLALAYAIGGILAAAGIVLSLLYTGSAIATTAIGTLIPILSDSGELKTRFGTLLLGAGAVGEFGPILLDHADPLHGQRAPPRGDPDRCSWRSRSGSRCSRCGPPSRSVPLFERTLEKSSQLAVRWIVVLVFALALLASELGLDLLLGGFAAGLITRQVLKTARGPGVRLEALRGRLRRLHPVLLRRQRDAAGRRRAVRELRPACVKLFVFFGLFLVVRGTPALVLYRHALLDRRDRVALALVQLDAAAARARDHDARAGRRAHAVVDRRVARRGRRALDARLSDPRPAAPRRHAGGAARRQSRPGGARREPRPGSAPVPARPALARLGDVGAGARRERRRHRCWRSRCPSSTSALERAAASRSNPRPRSRSSARWRPA